MTTAVIAALIVLLAGGALLVGYLLRPSRGSARAQGPSSGWEYVVLGVVLSGVGGGLFAAGAPAWVAVIGWTLGGTLAMIGTVAVGVTVGLRRADWLRNP